MNKPAYAFLTLLLCACGDGDPALDGALTDDALRQQQATAPEGDTSNRQGSWSTGAAMLTRRTELMVTELNGRIYVAGGYGGLTAFDSYDPKANRWERHANLPAGRNHSALVGHDGKVYLIGGTPSDASGRSDLVWSYDPASNRWTERAKLLHQRYGAGAAVVNGKIYVIGGTGPNDKTVQIYDPAANSWTTGGNLSVTRDHVAVAVLDGKIWAIGGRVRDQVVYNTVEIYDPATNTFSAGPSMNDSHSGFGAGTIDGKIYVAGGEVLVQPYFVRDTTEVYEPATGKWRYQAKLPVPLHGTGAATYDGKFYLIGGASRAANAFPMTGGGVNIFTP